MKKFQRESAVRFDAQIEKSEVRDNWPVALQYRDEGHGPWLVDLAHKVRLDLQDRQIDERTPADVVVPQSPGASVLQNSVVVSRMNGTQASVYFLGKEQPGQMTDQAYTDVSETTCFLALFGPSVFWLVEKLTSLDFLAPDKKAPFLLQGPFCHVPCQLVTMQKDATGSGGILLSCSRGYAASMVEAILESGKEFGLQPAGDDRFTNWLAVLEKDS